MWGKEVRRLAQYGVNGGVGAGTEEGDLPSAAGNNYEQFVTTLKNLYGTIEISDKAVRASENNVGAFVNLLNAEMDGLIRSSAFNFGRMLFGDGSGLEKAAEEMGVSVLAKLPMDEQVARLCDSGEIERVICEELDGAADAVEGLLKG